VSAGKTSTERSREYRERRASVGATRLDLYADTRDHARIKQYARRLTERRLRDLDSLPTKGKR
jgi:hypothetical protein